MGIRGIQGRTRGSRAAGLFTALSFLLLAAQSQELPPWEKSPFEAAPADILAAVRSRKVEEGVGAVILLQQSRHTFQADGRGEVRSLTVYQVLTDEAAQENSVTQAEWAPWHQERPSIRARVITPDGKAHPLNPETLAEKPVSSGSEDIFTDRRMLTGPLPAMKAGSIVEVEKTTKQTRPFFDAGVVTYQHFGSGIPMERVRLILDAPDSLKVSHLARLLPGLTPKKETTDGRAILTFEGGPYPVNPPVEPHAPSDVPQVPHVAFTTGRGWNEVARKYHEIVQAQIADADLSVFGEIPGPDRPRNERIAALLATLNSKIRYVSLALGEASIVPRPPAETLKRGYGDCKDKSALLVAALRKAGIDAHVALLLTGPGPDVEPDLPGMGSFDHAIVHVGGEPELWLDPTDKFSKPGSLPLADQGRRALIAAPDSQALVQIPGSASRDNVELKIRDVFLSDFGSGRIVETWKPSGLTERNLREWLDQERKTVDKSLESYAGNVFNAPKLTKATYGTPTDLTKPMELRLELAEAGRAQTDLREAVVAIPLEGLWRDLPWILKEAEGREKPAQAGKPWRTADVLLSPACTVEWRYRIAPARGFQEAALPKSETLPLGPARLTKEFSRAEDGTVSALLRFDSVKTRYTPDEAKELRTALARVRRDGMILLRFSQKGAAHLEAGRIKEALAEYRTLAEAEPKKSLHRVQIARALLAGGLGDAARVEAQKAVDLEPGNLLAHQTLGWIRQHDLLGRRFERGWDPRGVESAYRDALKIHPGHLETTLDLAIVLEHDLLGQRYAPGARLDDAIALYQSVEKEISGKNFDNNLSITMMWAGRFAELSERLRNTATPVGQLLLIVCRAALDGSDAALNYAAQTYGADEQRRPALAEAGDLLVKLRKYPEAAALLTAAARGSADAARLLGRADRLEKTKRWEDAPQDVKDPGTAVKRLMALLMATSFDAQGLKAIISKYGLASTKEEDAAVEFREMHAGMIESLRKQPIPFQVMRDITLSLMEPSTEAVEGVGWRVRIPAVFGNGVTQLWFVRREQDGLRVLAAGEGGFGRLVLDLLGAGETDAARTWLDWAADSRAPSVLNDTPESEPFSVLWKKGKGGDAKAMRRAAAALAAGSAPGGDAITILEEARKEEEKDPKRSYVLDHALAQAFLRLERYEEAAAAAARMQAAEPDSNVACFLRLRVLVKLRKWEELDAATDERFRRKPDDLMLLHSLQHIEMARGRQSVSQDLGRRLLKLGQSDPSIYNNMAWAALLEGKVGEATLKDAQQSVMASQGRNDASLHTLATVYADLGRPSQARDVLLQTFQSRTNTDPQDHDWYVLGRIAEEYGAREAALSAYRRTAGAKDADQPNSTNQLSLRRLKLLGEK